MKYAIVLVLLLLLAGCTTATPTPTLAAGRPPRRLPPRSAPTTATLSTVSPTDSTAARQRRPRSREATQTPCRHVGVPHGDALHRLVDGQHGGAPDLYDTACPSGVSHGDLPGHHGRAGTGARGGQ